MSPQSRRALGRAGLFLGSVVTSVLVLIILIGAWMEWGDPRGVVEYIVSTRMGRPVSIIGPLRAQLFAFSPHFTVEGLELGNLPWAGPTSKAHVDHLDAQMRLLPPRTFSLNIASGNTRIHAQGSAGNPFTLGSYRAAVRMSGDDLADLYYLTGIAIPNTPAYELSTEVHESAGQIFLRNFAGKIGNSDVHGDATLQLRGPRPRVEANLVSKKLNLLDLAPAFGSKATPSGRLFPDAALQVDRLRAMDGALTLKADSIKTRKIPLRQVAVNLKLSHGVLVADPFELTLPQGKLTGNMTLDATADVPKTKLDARLTGVELEQFQTRESKQPPLAGVLRGRARLYGDGASVHQFVSNAHGSVTAVVPHGEIREAFAELTGINVARGLGLLLMKDQERTGVRCGVADFAMRRGTLTAQNLVFDTDDVLIEGKGKIDLANEVFDLSIKGHPKKLRVLRVKSPIQIEGPLRKPKVGLEAGKAAEQTGVAVVLGTIIAPLAAVIAFVDPGLADDVDCKALLAEAKSKGAPVRTADIEKAKTAD